MKIIARAHTNIALIKYWGKADSSLKIPLMSSISMTLDAFYTETEFTHNVDLANDMLIMNGKAVNDQASCRIINYVKKLQDIYGFNDHFCIKTENHVPTAAGLASSASGFAALATSFAASYNLNLNRQELSRIARLGSGSATRSIFGGFVEWQKGYDDQTSFAFPINEHPQMDLTMLAIELDVSPKEISSTCGMKIAQTSPFYQTWLNRNKQEISEMESAIKNNNFTRLGELSELSANEMHSLNLTAMPSFSYFQPTTITIMNLVRNLRKNGIECYYTIDAGPNVKILCQDKNVEDICKAIHNTLDSVKIIKSKFGPGVQIINCDD